MGNEANKMFPILLECTKLGQFHVHNEKQNMEPMGFILGIFLNFKSMGFYFGGLQNGEIR